MVRGICKLAMIALNCATFAYLTWAAMVALDYALQFREL